MAATSYFTWTVVFFSVFFLYEAVDPISSFVKILTEQHWKQYSNFDGHVCLEIKATDIMDM